MLMKAELPEYPSCEHPLTMNLRSYNKFAEDESRQAAAVEYETWLIQHQNRKIVFLKIGVGYNTPVSSNTVSGSRCTRTNPRPIPA